MRGGFLWHRLDLDPASGSQHDGMTATNPAIAVAGLTKSYGDHSVLAGVDLTVAEGTVYALLGPNGAGKTTIVNILSTLLTPGEGEICVAGFDVRREAAGVRAAIGVTGQFSAIDELLTGRENLRLMADLDENNYATYYEYDDDGTLIRVKKETERGIMTVQESRSALLKDN